jgi:hypothetical protein
MQTQVVKVMVGAFTVTILTKKVIFHVFICETLANITQVSDVAPGLLFKS